MQRCPNCGSLLFSDYGEPYCITCGDPRPRCPNCRGPMIERNEWFVCARCGDIRLGGYNV